MDEDTRCVSCGHFPDVCSCPHTCVSQRDEATRVAGLERFLGGPVDVSKAEDVFELLDRSVA